ncbi:MAG: hypothetical protein AABN95_26610 [Acidobacteriota bacterium]
MDKQYGSLDKVLSRVKLSYFDTSTYRNYSPSELGLDTHATMIVRGAFLDGAAAVTITTDPINIFLSDEPFNRTDLYFYSNIADTSSYIVHELFHADETKRPHADFQH